MLGALTSFLGGETSRGRRASSVEPPISEVDVCVCRRSPVADACGLAGGTPWAAIAPEEGQYINTTHAHHGMKGTDLQEMPTGTVWKAGGIADVVCE